jgi:hypothetical protein
MFHVCKEAREEAEKIYQLRTFDTMTPNGSERYIYYNPQCDIIYFSNHTCVSNIVSVFCQQPRLPIPRVAINLSAKGLQCCDWDDDNYGVDGGLTFMGALHGIFPPVVRENETRFPGCLGLEEVFWVVQSNLWHLDQGKIDATVSMRHATTNGLTKGQRSFKKHTLFSMKCVKDGAWCAGTNLWTGTENEPKFHFISFAPHPQYDGVSTTYYDGLGVNTPAVQFLGRNNWAVVKKIEKSTGCVITVARQSFRNEEPREIGFMGGEKSIENAKALVLEKLATFEKTIVTKVADVYEDEWLNLRQVREGEL